MTDGLVATVSFSMKVNLGNYESADCFISVSNIDLDTTAYEVDALLNGPAQIVYDLIKARIQSRANALKSPPAPKGVPEAPGSTISPKPASRPKPKLVRHPEGKLGALRDEELAIFRQLREAKVVEPATADQTPDGSLLREAYRVKWSGIVMFDRENETDMMNWLQVLARVRDEKIPAPGLEGGASAE